MWQVYHMSTVGILSVRQAIEGNDWLLTHPRLTFLPPVSIPAVKFDKGATY